MAGKGTWMARYVLVIVITLVLGGVIGELALFRQTTLGTPRLNASMLVKFMGFGGALLLLWLLGQRAANQLRATDGKAAFLSFIVFPLTTLIVVSVGLQRLPNHLASFSRSGAEKSLQLGVRSWYHHGSAVACSFDISSFRAADRFVQGGSGESVGSLRWAVSRL